MFTSGRSLAESISSWEEVREGISSFDPAAGSTCPGEISYEQFVAHISETESDVSTYGMQWHIFMLSFDYISESRNLPQWLSEERQWISEHQPTACFEASLGQWSRAVEELRTFTLTHGGPFAMTEAQLADLRETWPAVFSAVTDFHPATDSTCVGPISLADFSAHIDAVQTSFREHNTEWEGLLDQAGFDRGLVPIQNWIPDEAQWVDANRPHRCLADPYDRWTAITRDYTDAFDDFGAAASGTIEQRWARDAWNVARFKILAFNPGYLATCEVST